MQVENKIWLLYKLDFMFPERVCSESLKFRHVPRSGTMALFYSRAKSNSLWQSFPTASGLYHCQERFTHVYPCVTVAGTTYLISLCICIEHYEQLKTNVLYNSVLKIWETYSSQILEIRKSFTGSTFRRNLFSCNSVQSITFKAAALTCFLVLNVYKRPLRQIYYVKIYLVQIRLWDTFCINLSPSFSKRSMF